MGERIEARGTLPVQFCQNTLIMIVVMVIIVAMVEVIYRLKALIVVIIEVLACMRVTARTSEGDVAIEIT